jgi:chaperonin GroEL (HSP60 family)
LGFNGTFGKGGTRQAIDQSRSCRTLPGGGVALLRSVKALGKLKTENHDQKTGIEIVGKAISTPARQNALAVVGKLPVTY